MTGLSKPRCGAISPPLRIAMRARAEEEDAYGDALDAASNAVVRLVAAARL